MSNKYCSILTPRSKLMMLLMATPNNIKGMVSPKKKVVRFMSRDCMLSIPKHRGNKL
jgi:hypothetical protein